MKSATSRWVAAIVLPLALTASGCIGNFKSNSSCVPQCSDRMCGGDGCGGICGTCPPGEACTEDGACVSRFCGNGRLDPQETCDQAIPAGQPGACVSECEMDDNECTTQEFKGSAAVCDAECTTYQIIACEDGDGCCPQGCAAQGDSDCSTTCGNGELDELETCDGDCPTEADCMDMDGDACTTPTLTGSADTCNAACAEVTVTQCVSGDGCCPDTCSVANDDDCDFVCGDGVRSGAEQCDNAIAAGMPDACPLDVATDCPDTDTDDDACTVAEILGTPDDCSARCNLRTIDTPADGDGCCPAGANAENDDDCAAVCGNMVVEAGEECDNTIPAGTAGACPADVQTDCPDTDTDDDACTVAEIVGMAGDCSARCNLMTITAEIDGDGCCPSGATPDTDDDCAAVCGDGVVESPETCDSAIPAGDAGYCPVDAAADCDDLDACTTDTIIGAAATCDAECENTPITACVGGDGCCVSNCTLSEDSDCLPLCDDYCTQALTNCVGGLALFSDDDASGDAMDECLAACQAYTFDVGTDQDTANDTLWCRINHLELAAGDPDTHCPHGAEASSVCI